MQFGILHVTQDPGGVVQFAVVQIGQRRHCFGVLMGAADVFGLTDVALKQPQEPHHLSGEQFNVALGIQQLIAGLLDFLRTGIGPQQALLFHFTEPQLRRAVGAEQTGMGC